MSEGTGRNDPLLASVDQQETSSSRIEGRFSEECGSEGREELNRSSTATIATTPTQRWSCVFALFALATMIQADVFVLPFLFALPKDKGPHTSIRSDLSLTETEFGLLTSYIGIVPRLLLIVCAGRISAFFPSQKRHLVLASGFTLVAGMGLYYMATSFETLVPAIILMNVGVGLNTPMNAILIGDLFDGSSRAMPIACVVCADYCGAGLAGLAGALALHFQSWRQAVLVYEAASVVAALLAAALVTQTRGLDRGLDFDESGHRPRRIRPDEGAGEDVGQSGQSLGEGGCSRHYLLNDDDDHDGGGVEEEQELGDENESGCSLSTPAVEEKRFNNEDVVVFASTATAVAGEASTGIRGGGGGGGGGISGTTAAVEGVVSRKRTVDRVSGGEDAAKRRSCSGNGGSNPYCRHEGCTGAEARGPGPGGDGGDGDCHDASLPAEDGDGGGGGAGFCDDGYDDDEDGGGDEGSTEIEGDAARRNERFGHLSQICCSPFMLLIYVGGGVRFGAGMSIANYSPQYFATVFPGTYGSYYALHATLSVVVCGTFAQLASGYVTQHFLPGLTVPVLTCFLGGLASVLLFLAPTFNSAVVLLYATWLLGEGWFVGVITTLQQGLTPGKARDSGLGLFFASSVLIGAADVFATSQGGIGSDDDGDDDGDDGSGDDSYSSSLHHGFWGWLFGLASSDDIDGFDEGDEGKLSARRALLVGTSAMYLLAGLVFAVAMATPKKWRFVS